MRQSHTSINDCKLVHLPLISADRKGNLTFVYEDDHIPFKLNRVYYLYDVPGGTDRGGHAHMEMQEILISVSGSFDVQLNDGQNTKTLNLSRPNYGLYVPKLIWIELKNFSSGCVCLVLASSLYDSDSYIHDFHRFLNYKKLK